MTRIAIDARFKGGSVRMAAASAAIDRGTPIDIVLSTGDGPAGPCSIPSTASVDLILFLHRSVALRWPDRPFKSQQGADDEALSEVG